MNQSKQHQQQQRWVINSYYNLYTEENSTFESCDINNVFMTTLMMMMLIMIILVMMMVLMMSIMMVMTDMMMTVMLVMLAVMTIMCTCLPMGKLGNLTKLLFLALAAVSI